MGDSVSQVGISWFLLILAVECGRRAVVGLRMERVLSGALQLQRQAAPTSIRSFPVPITPGVRARRFLRVGSSARLLAVGTGLLAGLLGQKVLGPLALIVGLAVGLAVPRAARKRQGRQIVVELERQLAELAESTAMAVRSGLSVTQSMQFSGGETSPPMSDHLDQMERELHLGAPFDEALHRFADGIGTPDAKLFTLVLTIHAKSGGNLGGALDEVSDTIRHRIAVRRELRALSAQGRISGSVLGALPIAFFLVLAVTSHRELAPVYRSSLGIAMVSIGLVMEGLAFVWIRRLLRVEA
jgi:tight adherence protein B